ncbi:MAG: putative selenium-dependent hydroxylase accessory protein YqeC [FCB group bacterium]|nr:putative selenium-dependent hydroxylase accessory protein YqeC [FCB group bacterium]
MNFIELFTENPFSLKGACIGLLGGGGKTTLLQRLGLEFSFVFEKVLLSSLTQSAYVPDEEVVFYETLEENNFSEIYSRSRTLFVMHPGEKDHKLKGLTPSELKLLWKKSELCVFECDGARQHPLKAHSSYDPEIPGFATHVIILVGAEVVDSTCSAGLVHRPQEFMRTWEIQTETTLSADFIARVITSSRGYLSKVSGAPSLLYFVNKWDIAPDKARELAGAISRCTDHPVFFGSLKDSTYMRVQ